MSNFWMDKVKTDFPIGSTVVILIGHFKGRKGRVVEINCSYPDDEVVVEVETFVGFAHLTFPPDFIEQSD
jgi:hypothetical protein